MNRRAITYVLLCTSLVVIVAAQFSFRQPAMWRWLQAGPATAPSATSQEEMPLLKEMPGGSEQPRRAPYPHRGTLSGAIDQEPFLAPVENDVPELQASARANSDANARYHLLSLAKDAAAGALEADARHDVRYSALLQKTGEYRGELIHIQGDLISLSEPMELHRKVPGMEVCYLGLMTNERPEYQYLVLFTDLPAELINLKDRWSQLYLRQVQFSGYFYKVARFTDPMNKKKSWMLPVLVGKQPALPELIAEEANWLNLLTIFIVMAVPVVLIALFVPRFFKKSDDRHESLMLGFRRRREEQITKTLEELPEKGPKQT